MQFQIKGSAEFLQHQIKVRLHNFLVLDQGGCRYFCGNSSRGVQEFCGIRLKQDSCSNGSRKLLDLCGSGSRGLQKFCGIRSRELQDFCGINSRELHYLFGFRSRGLQNFCNTRSRGLKDLSSVRLRLISVSSDQGGLLNVTTQHRQRLQSFYGIHFASMVSAAEWYTWNSTFRYDLNQLISLSVSP